MLGGVVMSALTLKVMFNTKLLLTVLVILYYCTTVSTDQYYVVAENTTDCLPADGECHPLSFYVAHSSSYFTNNANFYFKDGIHEFPSDISFERLKNISLIGLNQHFNLINATLYISSCNNISLVNITILLQSVTVSHSLDIDIDHVNLSTLNLYSSDVVIRNSIIYEFSGSFESLVACYDILNLKFTNSILNFINLIIQHDASYYLNVTMNNISTNRIYINCSSFHAININNILCQGVVGSGLYIQFFEGENKAKCHIGRPSYLKITNSTICNTKLGLFIIFASNLPEYEELLIDSCSICNSTNGLTVQGAHNVHVLPIILVKNTQISHCTNGILHVKTIVFKNVFINNSPSTGLTVKSSNLTIDGNLSLIHNTGIDGGGMSIYGCSQLVIYPNSILNFVENYASNKGGGLYSDSTYIDTTCIISVHDTSNVSANFVNNTASIGDDIYGIDLSSDYCNYVTQIFSSDIKRTPYPAYLNLCERYKYQSHIFPGQAVNFNVILYGYDYSRKRVTTEGTITVTMNDQHTEIYVKANCSRVSYTPKLTIPNNNYKLRIETDIHFTEQTTVNTVLFYVLPCPIGFTYTLGICTCSSSITAENITCNIETLQISHKGQLWIGPYNTSITFNVDQPNHHNICLINEQCLLCNPSNVSFMLNDTNPQCQQHKSGTLCGSCTTGYSIVLGSNECMKCTTDNMALIILFAFMGIALVVLLIVLNLTVSVGTINGLLFTANTIKLYQPVFLGNQIPIPFFNQIISWLNLDFGIKICFYNGMDRYVKEWLQFVFPFYVWAIIIVIILICRVSSKASKLVGTNAVPVLATLLLLSYTKLLRTIVAVLHKRDITLYCQNSSHQLTVWYEDPTLQYAKGKHLYLFSFALIVLVLFCLPYTLFLLLNHLFEKYLTKYRLCSFLYKIKPVLDAYSGPMKDKYRFWPGLLLVARIPVLLAVALAENLIQFHYLLLSILLSVLVVIWLLTYFFQRVYNNRLHNFIETWFILMLTAMVALAMASDGVRYTTIWYNVSIGVFTCSFIAVIGYHLYLKLNKRFPHFVSAIKEKLKSLKRNTSKDQSRLIRAPSFELNRHDSITDLYEPVNTNDYILPQRSNTVPMTLIEIPK